MKKSKPIRVLKTVDIVRKLLKTKHGDRQIAKDTNTSKTTVRRYRTLLEKQQITRWEELEHLTPEALTMMFNPPPKRPNRKVRPDWAHIQSEMQRKHMTLTLLWSEYRKTQPDGLALSQFCLLYSQYLARLPSNMRQFHEPGQKMEVDWSGDRACYTDPSTGRTIYVQLFVCVLPASSLIYAYCMPTQKIPDFVDGLVHAFEYFGGVAVEIVSDNHKGAWSKVLPDPLATSAFQDCCRYYGAEPSPVRPYHPRDKSTVEGSVGFVQRQVLAAFRDKKFYSIDELNEAVAVRVEELNNQVMQVHKESRRTRFERMERHALMPLPAQRYNYDQYVEVARVPQDYHVEVLGHFYSVPHTLIGERVDARVGPDTVEILHMRRSVAHHPRSRHVGGHTTASEHQTSEHRHQASRSPDGIKAWAERESGHVHEVANEIFKRAFQPFVALRACEELRNLVRKHGSEAAQRACGIAMEMKSPTISSIKRILATENRPKTKLSVFHPRKQGGHSPEISPNENTPPARNAATDARGQPLGDRKTVRAVVRQSSEPS